MLGPDGVSGLRVLDLYAGTGAFGIEALSRGAASAEFAEADEQRCRDMRRSLQELGYEAAGRVHRGDALKAVERLEGRFDLVFADPPYGEDPFAGLLERLSGRGLLAGGAWVFLEHSARLELPDRLTGVRLQSRRRYGDTAVSVFRTE
jgi:16S rRNA (guanine966-N2)-methyltransferase